MVGGRLEWSWLYYLVGVVQVAVGGQPLGVYPNAPDSHCIFNTFTHSFGGLS